MLAIQHGNFAFLDAISESSSIFVKDDQYLSQTISQAFASQKIDGKVKILKFFAENLRNQSPEFKKIILQENKRQIGEFIDLLYAVQDGNSNSSFIPEGAGSIWKNLGTDFDTFVKFNKQIIEAYKIMRSKLQRVPNDDDRVIVGKMISPALHLSKMINQLAGEANLDQIKELARCGYDMANTIAPSFTTQKVYADQLPEYFPFENQKYHLSYALKYALLNQPQNRELCEYLYRQMDPEIWKPFYFEIMVLLGQAFGTNDALFRDLFNKKAYLMNKHLTVESRLSSFVNSR